MKLVKTAFGVIALQGVWAQEEDEPEPEDHHDDDDQGEDAYTHEFTGDSYSETIKDAPYTLVSWCDESQQCKDLSTIYGEAAKLIHNDSLHDVILAKVNCKKEEKLCKEQGISTFPSLQWHNRGNMSKYSGSVTDANQIFSWVKDNMASIVYDVSESEAQARIKARKYDVALYVFKGDASGKATADKVAKLLSGKEVGANMLYVTGGEQEVTVYRGTSETAKYTTGWNPETIKDWMIAERAPMFGEITEHNFDTYTEPGKDGIFWVCFSPEESEKMITQYSPVFVEVKEQGVSKWPIVWLDTKKFEDHAKEELGCADYPTIVLQKGNLLGDSGEGEEVPIEKFVRSFAKADNGPLDVAAVKKFLADIESGALQATPDHISEDDGADQEGEDADQEEL